MAVSGLKFRPLIVTIEPILPAAGEMPAITGGAYVKPASVLIPLGELTVISPVAPFPTIAVMPVSESTVKEAAGKFPNSTLVMPVK